MGGVIYSSRATQNVNDAILKTQLDVIVNQIKALEVKQDKHNGVIERTYELEKKQAETQRDMKTIYKTVDEVKDDVKEVREDMDNLAKSLSDIKEREIRLEGKIN